LEEEKKGGSPQNEAQPDIANNAGGVSHHGESFSGMNHVSNKREKLDESQRSK
jgi:hypothetical protein